MLQPTSLVSTSRSGIPNAYDHPFYISSRVVGENTYTLTNDPSCSPSGVTGAEVSLQTNRGNNQSRVGKAIHTLPPEDDSIHSGHLSKAHGLMRPKMCWLYPS